MSRWVKVTMGKPPIEEVIAPQPEALFGRVVAILEQARSNVVQAVNTNMVLAYWLIGREIVEELQGGEARAEYGKKVVEEPSGRLTEHYGKGFSQQSLQNFRYFYLAYPERLVISSPPGRKSGAGIPSPPGSELTVSQTGLPAGSAAQGFLPHLSWSHYRALMRVENAAARDFYEREASECGWSKAQLERQIHR